MPQVTYIHINSDIDRTPADVSTSSWTTYLATPILVSSSSEIRISLEACEIPNVLYNFGVDASVFWWIHDPAGANILKNIQIPTDRNFQDGTAFATWMTSAFTSAGANLTATFDTTSNKLSIRNDNLVPIRIVQSYRYGILNGTYNQAIDKLGFTQSLPLSIPEMGIVTADSVLRLLRTNCYYLTLDEVSSSQKEAMTPNPYRLGHKIIGRITAGNFGSLSQLQYLPASNVKISNNTISKFTFSLLDENLYPITVYAPVTLTLRVTMT
jgi:hypothetical protein